MEPGGAGFEATPCRARGKGKADLMWFHGKNILSSQNKLILLINRFFCTVKFNTKITCGSSYRQDVSKVPYISRNDIFLSLAVEAPLSTSHRVQLAMSTTFSKSRQYLAVARSWKRKKNKSDTISKKKKKNSKLSAGLACDLR